MLPCVTFMSCCTCFPFGFKQGIVVSPDYGLSFNISDINKSYSRPPMARKMMARFYHGCFELFLGSPGKRIPLLQTYDN